MFIAGKIKNLAIMTAAVSVFTAGAVSAAAAEAVITNPQPELHTSEYNGFTYAEAYTTVIVPEGVTVDNTSFRWIVTAEGDGYLTGAPEAEDHAVDTSTEDKADDAINADTPSDNTDTADVSDTDDSDILSVGGENEPEEDLVEFAEFENNTYTATVPANINTVITDAEITLGIIIKIDGNNLYGINNITNVVLEPVE